MPGPVTLSGDLELRRRDGGEAVAFTSTRQGAGYNSFAPQVAFVLQPGAPLAASTAYEVLDRRSKLPCGPSYPREPCDPGELTVIATFTTGDSADVTPPPTPAGASLKYEGLSRCTSLGCCGSYVAQNYTARWEAPEIPGAVLYNLHSGDMGSPQLLQDNQVPLATSCPGPGSTGGADPSRLLVQTGHIEVRAVDWAGNESPAARVGVIPANACENAGGGCSAGGAPAGGGWLVPMGLGGLLALRSRRRRFLARPGRLRCFRS
jgi:MYXO-CTERM domain-containing protein